MKKNLILLSTFAMTISASTSVVACGWEIISKKENYTTKNLNDLTNYEVDLDNQNSVWTNVENAVQTEIQRFFPNQEIEFNTDYQIEIPELDSETGKPKFIGVAKVEATPTSKFLTGEFKILIKKDLTKTLSDNALFPKEGLQEESEKVLGNILGEIKKWHPLAEENVDYEIIEKTGSWRIRSINPLIIFDFTFQLNKIIKASIADLANYEVDLDNENSVWTNVKIAIQTQIEALVPSQKIKLDVDYQIETPEISEKTGKPKFIGIAEVEATPTSEFLTGEFKILIKKDLTETLNNEPLFPKEGLEEESEKVLANILAEIKKWHPLAEENVDYEIIEKTGSWRIKSINPLIIFDFIFDFNIKNNQKNLSDLKNYLVDLDNQNSVWTNVKIAIQTQIEALVPNQVIKLNIDYQIETPELDSETGKPKVAGIVSVEALPTSKFLTGKFNILIKKDLTKILSDDALFPKTGTKELGEEVLSRINNAAQKWYPEAQEDIDYLRSYDWANKWLLKNLNPLITFVTFEYLITDIPDISTLNPNLENIEPSKLIFNVDDHELSLDKIKAVVDEEINNKLNLTEKAQLGIDYEIQDTLYDKSKSIQPGRYLVSALRTSRLIIGSFDLIIQKDLTEILSDDILFPKQGNIELGKEVIKKVVAEIKKWFPEAHNDVDDKDYVDYIIRDDVSWLAVILVTNTAVSFNLKDQNFNRPDSFYFFLTN